MKVLRLTGRSLFHAINYPSWFILRFLIWLSMRTTMLMAPSWMPKHTIRGAHVAMRRDMQKIALEVPACLREAQP